MSHLTQSTTIPCFPLLPAHIPVAPIVSKAFVYSWLVGWAQGLNKSTCRVGWAGLLCATQNSFLSFLFLSLFLFCFHAIDVSEQPNSTGWRSSANIFRKGLKSKYFRLQGPQSRRHNYSTLRLQCTNVHRQCGNRWARLCSNKALFKQADSRP